MHSGADNLRDSPQNNLMRYRWTTSGAAIQNWTLPQPLLFSEPEALKLFPTTAPTSKNKASETVMGTGRNRCCQQLNHLLRHFDLCAQFVTLSKWPAR